TLERGSDELIKWAAHDAAEAAAAQAPSSTATPVPGQAVSAPGEQQAPASMTADRSLDALQDLVSRYIQDDALDDIVVRLALQADRRELRDLIFERLRQGQSISDPRTAVALARATRHRVVASWAVALPAVLGARWTDGPGADAELRNAVREL